MKRKLRYLLPLLYLLLPSILSPLFRSMAGGEAYAQGIDAPYYGGISGVSLNFVGQYNPANCTPAYTNTATGGIDDGHSFSLVYNIECNPNVPYAGGVSGVSLNFVGQYNPANCTPTYYNTATGGIADGHAQNIAVYDDCINIYAGGNSGPVTVGIGAFANCNPTPVNIALGGIADGHFVDTTLNSICTPINNPCSTMVAEAGADVSICLYDSTQLQATGGVTYSWAPTTGLSNPNIANPIAKPTVTTTYIVSVTVDTCVRTDTVIVIVNPKPTPIISGITTICDGQSTTLSTAAGEAGYLWTPTGVTQPTITVSPSSTTTYSVKVNNAYCDTTVSATVTVNPTPIASISGTLSICVGSSTTLTAAGGGTYLWSTGETTASITVTPGVGSYSYWVTATNGFGCTSAKAYATVVVNPYPVVTITGTTTICQGNSTTLTASGGGTYLWVPGGQTTAAISVSTSGTDSVYVTTAGCTSSARAIVTVIPAATITGTTTVCSGTSTTLTAVGGGVSPTYLWTPDGQTTSSITVAPTNPPSASYNYSVTITDAVCSTTANATVTVNPLPNASVIASTTICYGASIAIGAAAVGSNTYSWSPSTGLSNPNIANPTATPSATTTYTLTETMAGTLCQKSNSVTITVVPPAAISGVTVTCSNVGTLIWAASGGGASPSYLWTQSGTAQTIIGGTASQTLTVSPLAAGSTTFTVTITDGATGCVSSANITVLVNAAPCAVVNVSSGGAADGHALGIMNNTFCAPITFLGGNGGGEANALGSFANCTPTYTNTATGGIADGHALGLMTNTLCAPITFLGGNGGGEANILGSFANCTPTYASTATGGTADGHALGLMTNILCAPVAFLGGWAGGEANILGSFANCTPAYTNTATGGVADGHTLSIMTNTLCTPISFFGGNGGGEANALGSFANCTPAYAATFGRGGAADGHHLDAPPLCMLRSLPIELLSFTAALNNNRQVLCKWVTESETNNDYFTIEKTIDTKTYFVVDTVNGAGNSNTTLSYFLTDKNPFMGTSYYRLKQTDFDGAFKYAQLVPIYVSDEITNGITVNLYPNPTTETLNVFLSGDENMNISIHISDMLGRKVYSKKESAEKGNNRYIIQTINFREGVYFLNIVNTITNEPISMKRFVKM